ncbi:hypothetical protein [Rhodococcus sp. NPDC006774]|uniref:hypothetical protein n=1 Tax=Rhodococcus sp. NPDC006774 TaxID=3157186 RepID=UPI00340B84B0
MERLPRRTPSGDLNLLGMVFDALATMVEDIPIIGDIVGFVASLFGNSSASNARIARLETIVSKGSSGYDDFNRADTGSALGRGPQMTADWVQGGNGEQLRISGRAARLVEGSLAPAQGRRWARYPTPASSSTMTADTICDDKNIDTSACTTLIVCANEAFTEGIYANVFGTGVYLGKFTRSGTSWSFNDFSGGSNAVYKIGTAERIELRASGSGLYQLVVENSVVASAEDTSFPIDAAHRYCGFAIQMVIPFPFNYQYGWGLSAFSMKSEAGTFTAIEAVETVANGAATVANGAQTAAENAVGTAVTEATAAAESAALTIITPVQNAVNLIQSTAPTKPYYVTMNKTQDVTFPRTELDGALKRGATSTAAISPFVGRVTISTGDSDGGKDWYTTFTPAYLPPADTVEAVFIPAEYPGPRGTITFIAEAVTSPCPLQVVVGRMRSDGKPVIEWVSPNQTGIMSNGRIEYTVTMPDDLLFADGENMWAGIHQYGSGTVRALFGKEYADIPRSGDQYPPQAKHSIASSSSLSGSVGSVIETSSLSFTSRFLPWIGVGQRFTTVVVPRQFSDPFSDAMSSRWSQKSTQPAAISGGYFTVSGLNDGVRRYLWSQPLSSDDQSVEGVIGTGVSAKYQRLILRSNPSNTQYVALTISSGGVTLDLVSSESYTGLATNAHSVATGTTYRVSAIDNLFQVEMKTSGSSTWTVLFTYLDSGNAIPRGEGYRYVGIGVERQPFAVNSGNWDSWRAADVESAP